ncbi:MAG TPA: peptide ABC transporter substrate-binding protein, partial [Brochothrix thermosphacta]|nr:peptide ABC transporter substrate-binding protein [Brochothrix thermosphacta]
LVEASTTQAAKPLERWNTYIEAEKIAIKDDAASAPLYQNAIASLENPKLKNFKRFPYTMTALKYVYLEK